jgi:hypothetical protein
MTRQSTRILILLGSALALTVACGGDNAAGLDNNDVAERDTQMDDTAEEPDVDDDTDGSGDADVEDDADGSGEPDVPVATGCPEDMCEVEGKCFANGDPNPENGCEICLVAANPLGWSYDDTASCDDGDSCTLEDTCFQGACMGTLDACDDGNPCTAGICDPLTGECSFVARSGACSDDDPCSVGDYCSAGECVSGSAQLACSDGNQCTANRCEPGVGCVAIPLDGRDCDDGTVCTTGDVCMDGVCVGGDEPVDCDDGNLCTVNWCDPELGCRSRSIADLCDTDNPCATPSCDPEQGCVYIPTDIPCDDGTTCTTGDWCTDGVCRGTPVPTDDGNPCTDDICVDGVVGNVPHTRSCDDNNACTIGDVCADGGCIPGTTPRNCDDGNPCTDDYCDADLGCVNEYNTLPCDDGEICTWGDRCQLGECVAFDTQCPSNNPCVVSFCSPIDGQCDYDVLQTAECRPDLTVTYPPRGVTILDDGSGTVVVRGNAVSGAGGAMSVTVNGHFATVQPNGDFVAPIQPGHGGTILIIEATDSLGTKSRAVQSFLFSDAYVLPNAAGTVGHVGEGMGFYMGNEALGVLGNIMSLALDNYDLSGILPDEIADEAGHEITPRGANPIVFGPANAQLTARTPSLAGYPAKMNLRITIPQVRVYLEIDGWACDGDITYSASSLLVTADLHLRVVGNALDSALTGTNATVSGGDLDVDCSFPGLGSLIEAAVGDIDGDIEDAIRDALGGEIGPLVAEAFDAFALEFDFDLPSIDPAAPPISVTMQTDFQRVSSDNDGLAMVQRSMVATEHLVPYTNLGVPMRGRCGAGGQQVVFLEDAPLEVVLSDDSINQLLHGAWRGGLFEFDVPPEMLGDVDLTEYGVSDLSLRASGMLAPTVSDCVIAGWYWLHIGDLAIDASMNLLGTPLDATLYVSLNANLQLTASGGEIGLGISSIDRVEMQVVVEDPELYELGQVLEGLVGDALVPGLLGALGGDALGSFPLPEIDISESIDGVPAGTLLRIVPTRVDRIDGNNIIAAFLNMVSP